MTTMNATRARLVNALREDLDAIAVNGQATLGGEVFKASGFARGSETWMWLDDSTWTYKPIGRMPSAVLYLIERGA